MTRPALRPGAIVLAASLVVAGSARAEPPGWCKVDHDTQVTLTGLRDALGSDDAAWALPEIVGAMCHPDDEAATHMPELEAARRRWSERLDLRYEDWADVAAWAAAPRANRGAPVLAWDGARAWSSLDPIDQYAALLSSEGERADPSYLADALGARLSECGRLAYVTWCLRSRDRTHWAACRRDATALDPHRIAAELHGDQRHDGYTRIAIRLAAFALPAAIEAHAKSIARSGSDAAYARQLAAADAARVAWEGAARAREPLLALLAALDDAHAADAARVGAARRGCRETTWAAWQAALGRLPARRFAELRRERPGSIVAAALRILLADPDAYLAAAARVRCEDDPDTLVRALGAALERSPGLRGPRSAALGAAIAAGATLELRRAGFPGAPPPPEIEETIASLRPAPGGRLRAELARRGVTEGRCVAYGPPNGMSQIPARDGLVDERSCLREEAVRVERTPPPRLLRTRYGHGLRPGVAATIVDDVPAIVWPRVGAPLPIAVGGVALRR